MKLAKPLLVAAACVTALLALPAMSSATVATSPKGTVYTGNLHIVSSGHMVLTGPGTIKVECKWTFSGKVEKHGAGVTVSGAFAELTMTSCTNGYSAVVFNGGSYEIHSTGTVMSTGAQFTIITPLGFSCTYTTNGTDIGTLVNSAALGGSTAGIGTINRPIPRTGDSGLCGAAGELNGTWSVNTPDYLDIDA